MSQTKIIYLSDLPKEWQSCFTECRCVKAREALVAVQGYFFPDDSQPFKLAVLGETLPLQTRASNLEIRCPLCHDCGLIPTRQGLRLRETLLAVMFFGAMPSAVDTGK